MNELLGRLSSVFVQPAPRRPPLATVASSLPAESIALLCPPEEAVALGSGVALATARRARTPFAIAALWRPGGPATSGLGAPSGHRARRLCSSLRARGLRAYTAGRVVRIDLPGDAEAAVGALGRATAASEAPCVFVVTGPRTAALDDVLADQDTLIIASEDPDDPLSRLAAARLATLGPPVRRIPASLPPISRALALAGLTAKVPAPFPEEA